MEIDKKKEILQKIFNKEIKSLNEIEKKFQRDDDVLKLYLMTFHQRLLVGAPNIKKKLEELIIELKTTNPIVWYKMQYPELTDNSHKTKKEIKRLAEEKLLEEQAAKNLFSLVPKEKNKIENLKKLKKVEHILDNKQIEIEKKRLTKEIIKKNIKLKDAPDFVRKDKDIVGKLISKDINYYKEIHDSLKSDTYFNTGLIVFENIKPKKLSHFFFNLYRRGLDFNIQVLKEVIGFIPSNQKVSFFKKLSNIIKSDKKLIISLIKNYIPIFKYLSDKNKNDIEILKSEILINSSSSIKDAPKALQDDQDLILAIVKKNPKLFQFASKNLKSNKIFIMDLIEDNEYLLKKIFNLLDKSLINDQNFILDLIRKFPESHYLHSSVNDNQFHKIKLEALLTKLDTASEYNTIADDIQIDDLHPSILGDINITTKDFLIQYLNKKHKHNEELLFSEFSYSPSFIKHLHPLLLKDEDLLMRFQLFPNFNKEDLELFDKSLVKKFLNKKLYKSFKLKFWDGSPSSFWYYVKHINKTKKTSLSSYSFDWYKFNESAMGDLGGQVFSLRDYKIINNIFSKFEFEDKSQNKYFGKSEQLPKEGFPTNSNGKDESIGYDIQHYDYTENPKEYSKLKYVAQDNGVYEIDKEFNFIFNISDYVKLQMVYNSIRSLYTTFISRKDIDESKNLFKSEQKNIEDFFITYAPVFLNVKTKNTSKLNELFLKELNYPITNKNLKIISLSIEDDVHPPRDEWERDEYPSQFTGITITIEYKGIENKFVI